MNFHSKRTVRAQGLLVVAVIAAAALLASCTSTGSVKFKVKFPQERHKKAETKVEHKKEPRAEVKVKKEKKHGPPPHAPAHGYSHRRPDGTELVFDGSLSVYVVVDLSGTYFQDDLYIRSNKGRWEVSESLDGPWRRAASKEVPSKLKAGRGRDHPGKDRISKKK